MSSALITARPPRIAVIGTGLGSAPHFQSLHDLAQSAEVGWIYGSRAESMASNYGFAAAQKAASVEQIANDSSIAGVLVLTPPNTHLDVVSTLAAAGKHVLVEKPLDITLARANALIEVCERNGVILAIMLQHRMRPAASMLDKMISSGELGDLVSAAAFVRWWRPQGYYDEPGRGTLARDGGGVLMTQAIHTLDLLLSFTGLPRRVTGLVTTSPAHRMEAEDTAAALLQFANEASAVVQATTAAYPGYAERIELNLTKGSATLESGVLRVNLMDGRTLVEGGDEGSGGGADPMAFDHAPHRVVIQDFLQAMSNGVAPAVSGRSALGVQRVIEAIISSSESGLAVTL